MRLYTLLIAGFLDVLACFCFSLTFVYGVGVGSAVDVTFNLSVVFWVSIYIALLAIGLLASINLDHDQNE